MFGTILPQHIAILIPIIAVGGGIVIAIVAVIVEGRNKDLKHRERIVAMEKGIPLPEEPVAKQRLPYAGRRAAGLFFMGLGIGLTIALWVVADATGGVWGFLPILFGLGLIISASLDKKELAEKEAQESAGQM